MFVPTSDPDDRFEGPDPVRSIQTYSLPETVLFVENTVRLVVYSTKNVGEETVEGIRFRISKLFTSESSMIHGPSHGL